METPKHTPGPWKVDEWNYSTATPPHKDLVVLNSEMKLATVDWDEGNDNPYTVQEQTAKANARLIAAAPDMLAALRGLMRAVSGEAVEATCYAAAITVAVKIARAAIAKAEERE